MGKLSGCRGKTVVIGLGNPILSDDSVGIKVAGLLRERLGCWPGMVDVKEVYAGGIRLMDEMAGYERAIIIDAVVLGGAPGSVSLLSAGDVYGARHLASTHDTGLATALETGRILGLTLPSDIMILGIEARDVETFSEELTDEVKQAVPVAVEQVYALLADCSGHCEVMG